MSRRHTTLLTTLAGLLLSGSLAVQAHQGATGIVKERMDSMKAMGDAMKAMSAIVKGKQPFELETFSRGSATILEHNQHLLMMFPEGSATGKSEALPKIWQQWPKFEQQAETSRGEAQRLADLAAQEADFKALRKQFVLLGKSCKGCHTDFRKPKK
ncbi:c-type cytochrome [Motiliproteus sp.]|uniref:c-type cytochrome n=1 Tax=Motiliproteus sp. TaxID=1898955 RepID=UPI003BAD1077